MNKQEIEILKDIAKLAYDSHNIGGEDKLICYNKILEKIDKISPKQTKGTRLPDDWELPREWGEWALGEGFDGKQVLNIADQFKDFWIAKSGKDALKVNWESTWRNWIRRQQ